MMDLYQSAAAKAEMMMITSLSSTAVTSVRFFEIRHGNEPDTTLLIVDRHPSLLLARHSSHLKDKTRKRWSIPSSSSYCKISTSRSSQNTSATWKLFALFTSHLGRS
eukprot:m.58985 g.58985  ORF g.58985 m.58985 type:complete len:107 (-) comp13193_c0_seq1:279-599(-)